MGGIRDLEEKVLPDECFVFKHSTRCPTSARAADRVRGETWTVPLLWVDVIEKRELSDWVADRLGVKHESPQLIRVAGGEAAKVWNHSNITQAKDIP